MKITLNDSNEFGWEGVKGWAYKSKDLKSMSGAYIKVTGRHGKLKNIASDRYYYIISGEGEFDVDGEILGVSNKDVVIIYKNTTYDYWATNDSTLELLLIDCPPYSPENDVLLDGELKLK